MRKQIPQNTFSTLVTNLKNNMLPWRKKALILFGRRDGDLRGLQMKLGI